MPTLEELASRPVGQDQIDRAYAYCHGDERLLAQVSEFLSRDPKRGQMVKFLEELRAGTIAIKRQLRAREICQSLGISEPSNTELLIADRNALLEDELTELRRQISAGFKATNKKIENAPGVMTGAVVGALVGAVI